MKQQKIESLIITTLQEVIEVTETKYSDSINANTGIFGRDGLLKSMGLVTLITDLEEKIEDEFEISLVLADEYAMSQKTSPFRSVSSLTDYIMKLVEE